jgi:hypothetical protein
MESSTTAELWVERVARWRASGEPADTFSRREGYATSTLRWWASKLKREMSVAPGPESKPAVQIARVVTTRPVVETGTRGAIILEVDAVGVRIAVEPGADAVTLGMVLDVIRRRG